MTISKERRRAISFFRSHAGFSDPPGRLASAKILADAEILAKSNGWELYTTPDPEPDLSFMSAEEKDLVQEVVCVELKNERNETVAGPVCGVIDPSSDDDRRMRAELAIEAALNELMEKARVGYEAEIARRGA